MSEADVRTPLRDGQSEQQVRSAAVTGCFPDADPARLRHLIILAHPDPKSFNHAVARAYAERVTSRGQTPILRDLYWLGFDPLLKAHERPGIPSFRMSPDVGTELDCVRAAAAIVMVYPVWFGMPPAMITGYVDRVLGAGFEIRSIRAGERHPALFGKQLVLLTTSGSTKAWLAERGQWQGLREAFDFYLESIFSFADCQHEHFDAIVSPLSPLYAAHCLERAGEQAERICATVLSAAHQRQKEAKLAAYKAGHP